MSEIGAQVLTAVLSMGLSALGTVLVLKNSMAWHKEKLDRHSDALSRAFAQGESLQREIHRLELEIVKLKRAD